MPDDQPPERAVRLVVTDDLVRSRATVFFRWLLLIPVWIAFGFWTGAAIVVLIGAWFVTLVRGRCSSGLHEFLAAYVCYSVQVAAYFHLTANPYPGFVPKRDYPVRVEIAGPAMQRRWSVFFRIFLAIPALLLAGATGGTNVPSPPNYNAPATSGFAGLGAGLVAVTIGFAAGGFISFLGWFASLARGRMPRGLRDFSAYGVGYTAQTYAYLLLLTDQYPSTDPRLAGPMELPEHPVRIDVLDDLQRPRLLVAFRLLLAMPHFVWLALWTVAAFLAGLLTWLVAPFIARVPKPLHRFLAAYVRYAAHVSAFVSLVGGPFPGFVGREGSYPIDIVIDPPERQGRAGLVFRGILVLPALLIAGVYSGITYTSTLLGWWYAIVRGRMPVGLRDIGAAAIRYQAQTSAYAFLLTPRYPYAAPALVDTPPEPPPYEQLSLELVG